MTFASKENSGAHPQSTNKHSPGRSVTYGSADKVEKYVVFNVGGNKYRLIAIVSYPKGKVYIQHVLTHKEYDRGTWKDD